MKVVCLVIMVAVGVAVMHDNVEARGWRQRQVADEDLWKRQLEGEDIWKRQLMSGDLTETRGLNEQLIACQMMKEECNLLNPDPQEYKKMLVYIGNLKQRKKMIGTDQYISSNASMCKNPKKWKPWIWQKCGEQDGICLESEQHKGRFIYPDGENVYKLNDASVPEIGEKFQFNVIRKSTENDRHIIQLRNNHTVKDLEVCIWIPLYTCKRKIVDQSNTLNDSNYPMELTLKYDSGLTLTNTTGNTKDIGGKLGTKDIGGKLGINAILSILGKLSFSVKKESSRAISNSRQLALKIPPCKNLEVWETIKLYEGYEIRSPMGLQFCLNDVNAGACT